MQMFQQTGLMVSFMQRIIWMDELSLEAQCHMIISMFARHFHLYVRGTLLVVEVSGAIWVSWYLGQSQTDKNTESTATPPNTNTQCGLFCSSMQLQICQRTNNKEYPHSNSSKFQMFIVVWISVLRSASNEEEDRSIAIQLVNLDEQFLCL